MYEGCKMQIEMLTANWQLIKEGLYRYGQEASADTQKATNNAFSEKWVDFNRQDADDQNKLQKFQKDWFLKLYGFDSESSLASWLSKYLVIVDAGCGLGFKSNWIASLTPDSLVVGIDYSASVILAHENFYRKNDNLIFAQGDIANTLIADGLIDLIICDQVIMHTQDPSNTLKELARISNNIGTVLCYWYKTKALSRELVDQHFRDNNQQFESKELWKLSEEVTALGKMLHELNVDADFPGISSLGIQGGRMSLQRFIYWNFLKCFWNEEIGYASSLSTNFDWYSPANAKRFSLSEVNQDLNNANLEAVFFHEEEACFSGRFKKRDNIHDEPVPCF
jgi:SAM-dependent methyltransferase